MKYLNLKNIVIAVLIVVCGLMAASMLWTHYHPATAPSKEFGPANPIPKTEGVKIVTVPGPKEIHTYEKETITEKLKLSDEITKDPNKQVVATSETKDKDGNKTDSIAVTDTSTGKTEIQTKVDRPFFAFLNNKEIGIRAGYGVRGRQADVYGKYTFVRFGDVYVGAYGEATASENGQANAKAMLDISCRF